MFQNISKIVKSNYFAYFITIVIVINAILVGFEITYNNNSIISAFQSICLIIFIFEISFRWIAKDSVLEYFKNSWNWFDIIIVGISVIHQFIYVEDTSVLSAFRIIRIFRVLRLLKAFPNIGLMARVLMKSLSSLLQAVSFLLIFMYLYSLIGIILFKGKTFVTNVKNEHIDPFGSISEALFSLFRVTTGEDWTDLRYNLMDVDGSNWIVNTYYVSWMVFSAFLLLNIIIGAIVNNYEQESEKLGNIKRESQINEILNKLNKIESKLNI